MKVNICKITVKIASFDKVKLCVLTEHFRENVINICKKTASDTRNRGGGGTWQRDGGIYFVNYFCLNSPFLCLYCPRGEEQLTLCVFLLLLLCYIALDYCNAVWKCTPNISPLWNTFISTSQFFYTLNSKKEIGHKKKSLV